MHYEIVLKYPFVRLIGFSIVAKIKQGKPRITSWRNRHFREKEWKRERERERESNY